MFREKKKKSIGSGERVCSRNKKAKIEMEEKSGKEKSGKDKRNE